MSYKHAVMHTQPAHLYIWTILEWRSMLLCLNVCISGWT